MPGPLVGLAATGVGAFTSFLGAQSQRRFFENLTGEVRGTFGVGPQQQRFQNLLKLNQPFLASGEASARGMAATEGERVAGRFRRAGLSGIGEDQAAGARRAAFSRSRRASDAFKLELARQAQEQIIGERQALMGILQSPFGAVSPAAAAVSGAGTGLEAFVNANFAEQLAGRFNKDGGEEGG